MKKIAALGVCVALAILASGCATTSQGARTDDLVAKVGDLDARLSAVEQKVGVGEAKPCPSKKNMGYDASESSDTRLTKIEVQLALKNAGFYSGPIDGKFGAMTKKAVEGFQKANDLKVDGVVGAQTEKRLREYLKY
jgi:murein L,D-transpeptidase YcbB/YkuD